MDFMNRRFVITGASAGIGAALAIELARRGARLMLAARGREELEGVVRQCQAAGGQAFAVVTDVADPESCKALITAAKDKLGGIDCLVNNAGITMWSRFDEVTDLSLFEKVMRVNYLGTVYCTHYALPMLKESKGLLVAVSSLTGITGVPTRTGYSASKHAVQGFMDSLRIELMGTGVDVQVISPGFVATDIRARAARAGTVAPRTNTEEQPPNTMSVEECVAQMVEAIRLRRRELVMMRASRLARIAKVLVPQVIDRVALARVKERQ
jgi:short-subunit dehydrogenase